MSFIGKKNSSVLKFKYIFPIYLECNCFFRLPQDVYQTSKVAKILMIMNKGKGEKYRGKALAEIDVSAELESSGDESEKEDNVDDPESMNFSETVVENDDNKTTTIAKNTRYESPGSDASEKGNVFRRLLIFEISQSSLLQLIFPKALRVCKK